MRVLGIGFRGVVMVKQWYRIVMVTDVQEIVKKCQQLESEKEALKCIENYWCRAAVTKH